MPIFYGTRGGQLRVVQTGFAPLSAKVKLSPAYMGYGQWAVFDSRAFARWVPRMWGVGREDPARTGDSRDSTLPFATGLAWVRIPLGEAN